MSNTSINSNSLKMTLLGSRHEDTPLLNADSTTRLLDDCQSGTDSEAGLDVTTSAKYNERSALTYSNLRGAALAVAFFSWTLMAIPLMFWLLLPFVLIKWASLQASYQIIFTY